MSLPKSKTDLGSSTIRGFDMTPVSNSTTCADCAEGYYGSNCQSQCSKKCGPRVSCLQGPTGNGKCYCSGMTYGPQCIWCLCNSPTGGTCSTGMNGSVFFLFFEKGILGAFVFF